MAVVKANAYGHGIVEVAQFLESRADYLGVAIPEEGAQLRRAGVKSPIHVFTIPSRDQASLYPRNNLEATICSLNEARWLQSAAEHARRNVAIHLKIETGMNRLGVQVEQLPSLLRAISRMRRLEVKGVYSHFATADERDKRFARRQLEEFHRALGVIQRAKVSPELVHMANSGAILDLPESYFSMVRAGIMLYGYYPSHNTSEGIKLRPAMSFKSRVSLVKRIERGETVGYGRRFSARRRTNIATAPLGYADGFTRLLSGKGAVLIHGKKFPVAGSVAMDQLMIDAGNEDVRIGDEVVVIGTQRARSISAWDIADSLGTVAYEVCCWVSARVPRLYKK
jgi:alanine racemase